MYIYIYIDIYRYIDICIYEVTGVGILQIFYSFKGSIPHKQTFSLKLMESKANLFQKLMLFCSLLMWFQFTTNNNVTTTVQLHMLHLGW